MTNVCDLSPDASDDEDFQTQEYDEYAPFTDLQTLLDKPAHLGIFLNYSIMQNKPNNLLFVLCVHHYQRQEKLKDVRKAASEIFTDFLNPSAVLRVSFPPDVLNEISINLHQQKDSKLLQNIYNRAMLLATKQVNVMIRDFKMKLDMGLGNAYNVQALFDLNTREDELRVAKQVLIEKFEEIMKDTNDLHEEKNKALIAAVQYFLEDIGVLHGSSNISRSFSMNRRDVDKIAKKLHSLRNKEPVKTGLSSLNPLSAKRESSFTGVESDGFRDKLSPDGYPGYDDDDADDNRLLSHEAQVKRSKSLPKDHSVQPKRPVSGPVRPKSAAEDSDMFANDLMKHPSLSDDMHSSNSSEGSNRCSFLDPGAASAVENRNIKDSIEFEWDTDFDIVDDMIVWSQTHSQTIKARNMNKKTVQRQDVIYEFIHTEQHYVRKLKVLNVVYYNPLQERDIIQKVQLLWLFPNLDELVKIHKEFCNQLLERQKEQNPVDSICDIIITHLGRSDLKEACAKFCNHQKSALAMFKNSLQNSQDLRSFVYLAENHKVAKRLDLDQLIGCVLHRITKYPLLLNELKKCTKDETSPDFNKLTEAIKLSKDLATFVNLRIRETENANRLEKLQKSIDNQITEETEKMGHLHNMRINAPHRKLMYDGALILMIDKTKSLELLGLLMTDCIVLLQKQEARYLMKPLTYDLNQTEPKAPVIMLQDVHLTLIDKREKRFYIVNRNPKTFEMYELRCTNKDSKETWIRNITVAIEQFKSGKLKHLSYQDHVEHYTPADASPAKLSSDESEGSSEEESETESDNSSDTGPLATDGTLSLEDPVTPVAPNTPPAQRSTPPSSPNKSASKQQFAYAKRPSLHSKPSVPRQDAMELESELTSQDLIISAMNETRNIQRLSLSIGIDTDDDDVLKQKVQRTATTLNKNLQQLMTSVIAESQALVKAQDDKDQSEKKIRELEALLSKHGINSD